MSRGRGRGTRRRHRRGRSRRAGPAARRTTVRTRVRGRTRRVRRRRTRRARAPAAVRSSQRAKSASGQPNARLSIAQIARISSSSRGVRTTGAIRGNYRALQVACACAHPRRRELPFVRRVGGRPCRTARRPADRPGVRPPEHDRFRGWRERGGGIVGRARQPRRPCGVRRAARPRRCRARRHRHRQRGTVRTTGASAPADLRGHDPARDRDRHAALRFRSGDPRAAGGRRPHARGRAGPPHRHRHGGPARGGDRAGREGDHRRGGSDARGGAGVARAHRPVLPHGRATRGRRQFGPRRARPRRDGRGVAARARLRRRRRLLVPALRAAADRPSGARRQPARRLRANATAVWGMPSGSNASL